MLRAACALLASLFAICVAPAAAQTPELRVMGFAGASNWPVFVALDKGFFPREGVRVTLSPAPSSAAQMASLIEGRIEIAMTAMDNVVAHAEGDVFAFLGAASGGRFNLMVAPAVKRFTDLKGRTLAVDALANGYAFVLMDMLRREGLGAGDYELVSVGGSRERLAALRNGKAAGALLNAPQDAAAGAEGFVRLAGAEAIGRYQGSVGAARRAWAAANAAALIGYIRGYIAASDWLYEPANRGEALAILQRSANTSADNAGRSYDELLKEGILSRKAAIDLEGIGTVLRLRREYARPAKPLGDVSRYYDPVYYEKALRND
jgi:ABC-type nitrate/sulfonate/bicarbonate transport system substrate-binding protein